MNGAVPLPMIVGSARSGTTLLRAMLDSHPALAVAPESYFVLPMLQGRWRSRSVPALDPQAVAAELEAWPSFREWSLPRAEVEEALSRRPLATVADVITRVYGALAHHHGATIGCDKTPYLARHVGQLARALPTSMFIHLVRDGRDVAKSIADAPFWPDSVALGAVAWAESVGAVRDATPILGDRIITVRYEDLLDEPEAELRRITSFLELPYHDEMLRFHDRGADILQSSRRDEHLRNIARPLGTRSSSWTAVLTPLQVEQVERVGGSLLDHYGYEVRANRSVIGAVLTASARLHFVLARRRRHVRAFVRRLVRGRAAG